MSSIKYRRGRKSDLEIREDKGLKVLREDEIQLKYKPMQRSIWNHSIKIETFFLNIFKTKRRLMKIILSKIKLVCKYIL